MSAGGVERDFLIIDYADDDKLYVSLDQINMVQRYVGLDGRQPRIDSLGKKSAWNKIRDKVKESVEEIAKDLIEIYSKRQAMRGLPVPAGYAVAGGIRIEVRVRRNAGPDHGHRGRQGRHGVAAADGPAHLRRRGLRQNRGRDTRGVQSGHGRQTGRSTRAHHGPCDAAFLPRLKSVLPIIPSISK